MTELKCTVQTCAHNQDFYCNLDKIQVGGKEARDAKDTCCDSFEERRESSCCDVTGSASSSSKIDCKAMECKYNEDCHCHAGKISVEGSSACRSNETECATFCC